MSLVLNVYALGASRNIGYHTSLRLLAKGATVTYLVRSAETFNNNADMQTYVQSGHARIVQGDALKEADVAKGWAAASQDARVDLVLFTIGATPAGFSITKGALIEPHDICTAAILNLVRTIPESLRSDPPKILAVSSTGVDKTSHKNLPLLWRPFYSWGLSQPHADKLGMERVLTRGMDQAWEGPEPSQEILPSGWDTVSGLPAAGSLKNVVIIRPSLLTDGACKGVYRFGEEKDMKGHNGYTVSREDVAHFLAEEVVANGDKWVGKRVCVSY